MFSNHIVDTDAFLDMPASSQLLYFHLAMRADDEGFVGSPRKIMRMCGFQEDDLKILIAKRFLLSFESGVVVIKHWLIHNTIRMDRFSPTTYQSEKNTLITSENRAYTELGKPNGNQPATQVKLSKVKLSKDREETPLFKTRNYLINIPVEDVNELSSKFNCYEKGIRSKGEDLYNYCLANGRNYKNYKAFLINAVKKDFGERPPQDIEVQERIKATIAKSNSSSDYAKSLRSKFQFNN